MRGLAVALVLFAASSGCKKTQDDATTRKLLAGVWSFHPREQLPPESVSVGLGTSSTPIEEIFDLDATVPSDNDRGTYVEYRHTPKDDHTAETWTASKRGHWYVLDGTLYFQPATGPEEDMKVMSVNARYWRARGGPYFGCANGCELTRLAKLPDEARSVTPR